MARKKTGFGGRRSRCGVLPILVVVGALSSTVALAPVRADQGGGTAPSTIYAGVSVYRGGWRGTGSSCTWSAHNAVPGARTPLPVYKQVGTIRYQLYDKRCPGPTLEYVWIPELEPRRLSFNATAYLERILPPPTASFAPPAGNGVVQVGMWFWIPSSQWAPVSVTAWVPTPSGSRWATTTARPVRLVLDPGDGRFGTGAVSCPTAGTRWTSGYGDERPSPSGCEYTYGHSSAMAANRAHFPARVTLVWDVSWRSSTGQSGYAGQLRTSSSYAITVREIEALVTV